ncbi:hypothetical protein [Hyphobacterium sp.]|jgi:hypothetical protein|uniref:hypothetical protein n=1 Tax=Hyphobacterium sp. TaxID=2004662 RepID=UPI003BABE549
MSSIPGAHASLGFGRKRVEFYASPGVTADASHRRRGEHEVRNVDGHKQTLHLSRPDTPLENGETVTVLRLQSGPAHRSRPVALINHDRNAWTRTAPDATGVLGRSGITRALNWWLAMIAFIVATIAFSWPDVRLFMLEVDPALFASLPQLDLFAMANAQIPALAGFDLAAAIPGFGSLASQLGLPGWLTPSGLAFTLLLSALALFTYFARSWRIVWVPLYIVAALVAGLALGTASPLMPALLALAGVALLFCIGGTVNRTRDAARLEGRIARLSENILRNPPREAVTAPAAAGAALAASAAQAKAAEEVSETVSEPEIADAETSEPADESDASAEDGETRAGDDAESEAPDADDELPSDEELAAARADNERENGDDPAPVPSLAVPAAAENDDAADDREMILPPPPPLANRAVSESGGSGEAGEPESAEAPAMAAVVSDAEPQDEGATDPEDTPDLIQTPAEAAPPESVSERPQTGEEDAGTTPAEPEIDDAPRAETAAADDVEGETDDVEGSTALADDESDPFLTRASDEKSGDDAPADDRDNRS